MTGGIEMADIIEFRPAKRAPRADGQDGSESLDGWDRLIIGIADKIISEAQDNIREAFESAAAEYGLDDESYVVLLERLCLSLDAMAYQAMSEGGF